MMGCEGMQVFVKGEIRWNRRWEGGRGGTFEVQKETKVKANKQT